MARRVAVELVLEAAKYLFGVRNVAAETKAAAEAVHGLDNKVDGAGRSIDELAVSIIAGKKELEGFGDHAKEAGLDLELLDQRIDATKRKLALLALEFAATGDAASGKRFTSQRSLLAQLEALRGELSSGSSSPDRRIFDLLAGGVGEAAKVGEQAGSQFVSSISDTIGGKGKMILIGALVEAAVIAAVPVGAAISGAVSGLIGAGGIAGGIFAASKDPVVKSAATEFGSYLSQQFFAGGDSFVEPVRESLAILKTDVGKLDLGHVFEPAAANLTMLATGIGNFVTRAEPGFERALQHSGPFIAAIADGLGEMGSSLGQFMDDVSRNRGAVEGLRMLFVGLDMTVRVLGKTFETLSAINDWIIRRWVDMAHMAADLAGALGLPNAAMEALARKGDAFLSNTTAAIPAVQGLGDAFAGTAQDINVMSTALAAAQQHINDYISNALAVADANTAVAQDFADLNEKIKAGKKNWDDNTQAGRDNSNEIRRVIGDLDRQRQQAIATSDGSQAAIDAINRKYNDMEDQLETNLIKLGATKDAIEAIAGKAWHITIITDILSAATAAKASKTDKDLAKKGFASGGDPDPGDWAWVGEQGPELVRFGSQAHVYPTAQSSAMWGSAPAGSGAPIVVNNEITLLDPMTGQRTRAILITEATSRGVPQDIAKASYP